MAQGPWLLLSLSHGVATGHLCLEAMSSRCSLVGPGGTEVDTHSLPHTGRRALPKRKSGGHHLGMKGKGTNVLSPGPPESEFEIMLLST